LDARDTRRLLALTALLGLAVAATATGCSTMEKSEIEARLLALERNAPARAHGLSKQRVTLEIGGKAQEAELVYLRAGEPQASQVPVVLVHGTPSTLLHWTPLVFGASDFEGLAAHREIYAIEVAGHGMAPGDFGPYDFDRCAEFVIAALRALGLERAHLVGSSYGGEFAWRAALAGPELVASLVLIDSSGIARREGDFLPEEVAMRENPFANFGYLLNSRERITRALEPHYPDLTSDLVEEFYLVCANATNWRAMVALARDENGDRQDELPEIRCPTLLLWGSNDIAYAADYYAQRFADAIPRSELLVLETGHYPHEQDPARVVSELQRFFAEVER
jgi:pyruvate dehydrogenase E2 component (dihydrolipoamide acetyltransferase)